MAKKTELDGIISSREEAELKERRGKVMLYLNEWQYLRLKARCDQRDKSVSGVLDEVIKRLVDGDPNPEADREAEKDLRRKAGP